MSTFQGFNIMGIDRNKSPVILDDKIDYHKIYLALEPIDGCADVEAQKVWKNSFLHMVENWRKHKDFFLYKKVFETDLPLEFVVQDNYEFFICAEGLPLNSHVPFRFIKQLVKHTNKRFIKQIDEITRFRDDIDKFNSDEFGD